MEHYTKKGLYNSYDKNHKERDTLDYYATPPGETLNILNKLNLNLDNSVILEPACGGGHMVKDIQQYLQNKNYKAKIIATDIHEHEQFCDYNKQVGLEYDFISDNYPVEEKIDSVKKELKKSSRKRIESGYDVKTELVYIDIVRKIEKAGDCVYTIVQAL